MVELAEDYGRAAKALRAQGKTPEAILCLEKAVALAPHYAEAHMILGSIHADAGEWERAAEHCARAAAIVPDSSDVRRHFAQCVTGARFRWNPEGVAEELWRCFRDPKLDWQDLAAAAISILMLEPRPLENPLFKDVMAKTVAADPDFELFLTRVRREILLDGAYPSAAIWIALQCLNNEHVWAAQPDELTAPRRDAIRFAMYQPLSALPAALECELPAPLRERWVAWVEERELRKGFRRVAGDEITRRVQAQYEENPFPRWFSTTALPPMSVAELLRRQLPEFSPPAFLEESPKVLMAGCGTGKEAVTMALRHPDARITAIDISGASLSYARGMARKYGVNNVRFEQLNLLDAAHLGETFDMVECGGVLHHTADPFASWQALLNVLRPGGLMYVGLYSSLARTNIASARQRIASSGKSMQVFRQQLIRERESPEARELLTWPDFYSTSGCRDLLFHVHERRFALPEIREFLDREPLQFLGFLFRNSRALAEYRTMFPHAEKTDLDRWHAYELTRPDTFRHMYCFYCQKPA